MRAMVQHRQLNLLHDFSQLGVFDVIFCRNVLIYFDQETKVNIFNRLARRSSPTAFWARRCRNRGGSDRRIQTVSGTARPLSAEQPQHGAWKGAKWGRRNEVGCSRRALRHDRGKQRHRTRHVQPRLRRLHHGDRRDVASGLPAHAISDNDAVLTLEGSIQGLNLKEFFLLLSSTGLAYRRCELVRGERLGDGYPVPQGKNKKKRPSAGSNKETMAN